MKKQTTRQLYTNLLINKYDDTSIFLIEIRNENHIFWQICRDFSKEILCHSNAWNWLSFRVDDFASIIERDMIDKPEKWLKKGSLSKRSNSLEKTIHWLFDRHVNSLKNLFDSRYKNSLEFTILVNFEDIEVESQDEIINEITLENFINFTEHEKIEIFVKLWTDNLFNYEFDMSDLRQLCDKYQAPPPESFLLIDTTKKYKSEQAESGNFQLVFTF